MRDFVIGDVVTYGLDSYDYPCARIGMPAQMISGVVTESDADVFRVDSGPGRSWLFYQPSHKEFVEHAGAPSLVRSTESARVIIWKEELRYYTSQGIPSEVKFRAEERAKSWVRRNIASWPFHKILKSDTVISAVSNSESIITFNWYWEEDPAEPHPKSI